MAQSAMASELLECPWCLDDKPPEEFVHCSDPERHFVCCECFCGWLATGMRRPKKATPFDRESPATHAPFLCLSQP